MLSLKRRTIVCGAAALVLGGAGLVLGRPAGGGTAKTPPATPPVERKNDCDLATVERAPWCTKCNKLLEKEEIDKGKHKACDTATTTVPVCVKTYYACESCGKSSKTPGKCPADKTEMTKKVSKARLVWRCPTCHGTAEKAGKCGNATCQGKSLEQACELSGMLPHVKVWPQL
jgi:hypothetical protein